MKCFVTGGTGGVGQGLVRTLTKAGHQVVGLTRSESGKRLLEADGAEAVLGDMREGASWKSAAASAEAIIHAAQIPISRLSNRAHRKLVQSDKLALDNLFAAASDSLKAFVYTSGYLVYGPCHDGPVDEVEVPTPYAPIQYKVDHEQRVLKSGLPAMVLRPGAVYGTRGLFAKFSLNPTMKGGPARHPGDGEQTYSYIHTDDLGEAYRCCIENPKPGDYFSVVDDEPTTVKTMMTALAKEAGSKPPKALPAWLFKLVLSQMAPPLLDSTQASNGKLRSTFDWAPKYPTYREGVAALVAEYRDKKAS